MLHLRQNGVPSENANEETPSISSSVLDLIGNTPLIRLKRIYEGPGQLLAKAEFMQPGGSVKDRAAKAIILEARKSNRLKDGMTVIEMTSGNMGSGLGVVCASLGHPFIATMSAGNSVARARMMEGLGAKVILVPQVDGVPGQVTGADITAATQTAKSIAEENGYFYVDQFNAIEGITTHEETTGQEIIKQVGGRIDGWIASVGTGCTYMGVAKALKAKDQSTVCAIIEAEGSEILAGKKVVKSRHLIQGTGYGIIPPHWNSDLVDAAFNVTDEEVVFWRNQLATKEGIYVGYSAAANVCGAIKLLQSGLLTNKEPTVVTVLCDSGMKY